MEHYSALECISAGLLAAPGLVYTPTGTPPPASAAVLDPE